MTDEIHYFTNLTALEYVLVPPEHCLLMNRLAAGVSLLFLRHACRWGTHFCLTWTSISNHLLCACIFGNLHTVTERSTSSGNCWVSSWALVMTRLVTETMSNHTCSVYWISFVFQLFVVLIMHRHQRNSEHNEVDTSPGTRQESISAQGQQRLLCGQKGRRTLGFK